MARKTLPEVTYVFTPSTRTVVIPKTIPRERLLLITNVTTNTVIYNFSDPALTATQYYTYVSPGRIWADQETFNLNEIVSFGPNLYIVTTAGTSGTTPPTHTSGAVTATGGTAVLTFFKVAPAIGVEETHIVLNFNTSAMAATDKLQIVLEVPDNTLLPAETYVDPVSKFRVSQPQSLIDTDFEYGTQPTKWETLALTGNRPFAFFDVTTPFGVPGGAFGAITNVATAGGNPTRTVTVSHGTGTVPVGTPVFLQGNTNANVNGWFTVETSVLGSFTFTAPLPLAAGTSFFDATKSFGYVGTFYSGAFESTTGAERCGIGVNTGANASMVASTLTMTGASSVGTLITVVSTFGLAAGAFPSISAGTGTFAGGTFVTQVLSDTQFLVNVAPSVALSGASITVPVVTVTTLAPHGLFAGNFVSIVGTTASSNPPNGNWVVATVPTVNSFTVNVINAPGGGNITAANGAFRTVFSRSLAQNQHRPFDGGVNFTIGSTPSAGNQLIRQTRRYFRYQSGKGLQFSTGTMLKPLFQVNSMTASGTTVTVNTEFPHFLLPNSRVIVSGSTDAAYNGVFTVASTPTANSFTYIARTAPVNTTAPGFPLSVGPYSWSGSTIRLGMFDEQNGLFFEYDGQQLYAVVRKSTDQISGTVAVNAASSTITGTNTFFSTQVRPGDMLNIRGMSYMVTTVQSNTSLTISPEYRGTTNVTGVTVSLRRETRVPQSQWNIDKVDGTGPSGYLLDLNRIQMFYMDYSWYGAGAVRWGFKDQRGDVIYCHRLANAGVQTEAYMRSGNLPARYEVSTNPGAYSILTSTLSSAATSGLVLQDASLFPNSGTVIITGNTGTAPIEYVTYTSKTGNTLNGLTRAIAGGNIAPQTWTFSATAPIGVRLAGATFNPSVSHWGSSVIMDGRFDDDKQFIFQGGMSTSTNLSSLGARVALLSIRLAPSVDSGLTGPLGSRDVINRMQLTMAQTDIAAIAGAGNTIFRIELVLNGRLVNPGAPTWQNVGGSSLSQIMFHPTGGTLSTISGGETIYSFFITVPNAQTGYLTQDLSRVRDLGTSILGGGTITSGSTTASNIYPDGPDILTVVATLVAGPTAGNAINSRIAWTEAQA